jgi:hypothetical protein
MSSNKTKFFLQMKISKMKKMKMKMTDLEIGLEVIKDKMKNK